jgi:Amt family ammonium transporter
MNDDNNDPNPPLAGDEAWLLTSAALVFMMLPALALFYGGMVARSTVLHMMSLTLSAAAAGSVFWSLIGYSLAFGPDGNDGEGASGPLPPWGGFAYGFFDSADRLRVDTDVSEHAFFIFQCAFNAITVAVMSGAVAGRMAVLPFVLFCCAWTVLVYAPLAHWVFMPKGWLAHWGVLDFAGGLVVETASGVSAFVLAAWLGPGARGSAPASVHSVPLVVLGAGLLYVGWFGFNAGSALKADYSAGRAMANTHLAACAAMLSWVTCEVVAPLEPHSPAWHATAEEAEDAAAAAAAAGPRESTWLTGQATPLGAAIGTVVGLVAVTPACGYIGQMAAVLLGLVAAPVSYAATAALRRVRVDDRLECLPCHGVAGMVGVLFLGFFANTNDGASANGIFYGGGPGLLGKQAAALAITLALCAAGTSLSFLAVAGLARLAGVSLRVADESAPDMSEHGLDAYGLNGDAAGGVAVVSGGGGGGGDDGDVYIRSDTPPLPGEEDVRGKRDTRLAPLLP